MAGTTSALWRVDEGALPGCPVGSVVWFVNDGQSARVMRQGLGEVGLIASPGTTQAASADASSITLVNGSEGWQAKLSRLPVATVPAAAWVLPASGKEEQRLANWEMGRTGIPGPSDPRRAALEAEILVGGRLIVYQWTVSIILMTFKRSSEIKLVRRGRSAIIVGLPYTITSLLLGWWGIPWGPPFTIASIWRNLRGGRDVTRLVFPDLPLVPVQSTDVAPTRSSGLPPTHR